MLEKSLQSIRVERWLWVFIAVHMIAWTLAPYWIRHNLPLDAMEGITWGHQLEWGYDKNPFMNAWLTALAIKLGSNAEWIIYFFSQIAIAICFWSVWRLGKKFLQPIYALLAVFLLEGIQYYNLHAIDFNDNTLELGFWSLTILFFYKALREDKILLWLLTGFFAGVAMMTKYYTVLLLSSMILFLIVNPEARQYFRRTRLYLGALVFLAIMAPHILWLFSHDFVTVDYAIHRVNEIPIEWQHVFFPLQFTLQQLVTLLPMLVLFLILLLDKKIEFPFFRNPSTKVTACHLNSFDKTFLLLLGLGPFFLTILLSLIFGMKLRAAWGQPLLSLWGIIFLAWLPPQLTLAKFYRFTGLIFTFLLCTLIGYSIALIRANNPSSANYPGKTIAAVLTSEWHNQFHQPVAYVAGSRWLAGNVAFYSVDNPTVYIDWNKKNSPWIDEKKLREKGGIFVWDLSEKNVSPERIMARFKLSKPPKIMQFSWLRNKDLKPIEIGVAYLPPSKV